MFAFAPVVSVLTEEDGPTSVHLEFASSGIHAAEQSHGVTHLTFRNVVAYEWNAFEFHRVPISPDDIEFRLIEIIRSPIVDDILATGRYAKGAPRHFRLIFDDHGTYDIVCERVDIAAGTDGIERELRKT